MAFSLEKDMTNILKVNLDNVVSVVEKTYDREELIYACEFPVYYRLIDIVVASFYEKYNEFYECRVYEKAINNLSSKCFGILSLICLYKKASVFKIRKELLIEKEELDFCIKKICKAGLIKQISKYTYEIGDWSVLIPKELIAIELKLSKWQEALEQGIYNQSFAEYSFVVLDEEKINNYEKIEELYKDNNVGLLYLNNNGTVKIGVKPQKNNALDKYSNIYHKIKILKDFISNNDKWKQIP